MQEQDAVATLYARDAERQRLWRAAIKWPMYSVAVMPVVLAAGWRLWSGESVRLIQMCSFLLAAVLLLAWENLSNDCFDAETGVDHIGKPHSLVALMGERRPVARLSLAALVLGLALILLVALRSSPSVFGLVLLCCGLGYLYQGPPFRLGYRGLGEPLCWLAFGPCATAAALLALGPADLNGFGIPWHTALTLGAGPALATTLVLFCSHFPQVDEDAAHGKFSPVVRLGTRRSAALVPWIIALILALEWSPAFQGDWPFTVLLSGLGLPAGSGLIRLLRLHHNQPEKLFNSKFLALRFQILNGLGMSLGFALAPLLGLAHSSGL